MCGPQNDICMALLTTYQIVSSVFDVDCEEVPSRLQLELTDLQCSGDLTSKFYAYHIFDFQKNHMLEYRRFSTLSPPASK